MSGGHFKLEDILKCYTTTGTTSTHAADVTPNNIGNSTASNTFIATCKASDELGMHISLANKEKIVKGEFIDLASLLKNTNLNVKPVNQTISLVQGELVLQQKQQHQKINNIEQWTDAFVIYTSVYCQVHTHKFQDLLKYMCNIRIAAKRCSQYNFGWKQYDEQFRLKLAQSPTSSWANIDLEL